MDIEANNHEMIKPIDSPNTLNSPSKKMFIKTYGCQMNEYDTQKITDIMAKDNYILTDDYLDADLIVLNTCHIREKAAEKVYSELGRIKKKTSHKNPLVVLAGCVAQAEGEEIFKRSSNVNIVVGPQSYHNLSDLVKKALEHNDEISRDATKEASSNRKKNESQKLISLDFIEEKKFDFLEEELIYLQNPGNHIADSLLSLDAERTLKNQKLSVSSFVSIQEGCDKFCHFCVVPYTRGAEFSRPLEQVMREVLYQVSNGAQEIVLLGQNVNGYHGKHNGEEINLASLIRHIARISQIKRIRFTTSHPIDMDDDLINLFGEEPKLMPFFNLPVQSGSTKVLKLMNRKYTREYYLDIIRRLKNKRPDIAMSSDFIVGFPGETEEDFEDTISLVKEVGFAQSYSFKYSTRPGTPAAKLEQIDDDIKTRRLIKLQKTIADEQIKFNKQFLGRVLPVLFDRNGKFDNQIVGRTPYMQSIYLNNAKDLIGQMLNVKVTNVYANGLGGELASY